MLQGTAELQDWARHTAEPEEKGDKAAGVVAAVVNDALELEEKPATNGDTEKCDVR